MGKLNNNKGITLVMLVVTIIVLLILAGITISAITGGDSAMEQGQKAKNETEIQAEMEELQKIINQSAAKGIRHGNYSGSADSQTIRDALKKNKLIEENPDDVIIDGKNGWKVTGVKTGQKYKIRYDGEVTRIEELAPTKIYGKIADGVLYLRATEQTGYTEGTQWNDSTITKVIIEEPIAPANGLNFFKSCSNLEEIQYIENLHTENMYSMQSMFDGCLKLKSLDLSFFDTSKVTSMFLMFESCKALTNLNLRNFDTSNVTTMYGMFAQCENLKYINIDSFNTQKLNNMAYMFNHCSKLESINLISFNTSAVTQMQYLFNGCYVIKQLDLSSFNTSLVSNTNYMFCGNNNLKKIYVSNLWNNRSINSSDYMFTSCRNLIGGNDTKYNSDYIDKTYARIDGGSSNPGYFTSK